MSVERVSYADSRIYINDILLTGVSSCDITTNREVENLRELGRIDISNRILKSDQKPVAKISWVLGQGSTDPFFDFQNSGIISVESFNIKKKDIVGVNEIKSGFLTSYNVNASVGNLVNGDLEYEGINFSFYETGKLTLGDQTSDSYDVFIPSKISLSASFEEGDIFSFPIQSFQLSVPIPRKSIKAVGEMSPKYKIPQFPIEASINFTAIKNDITGLDFSKIVLEKGDFTFDLRTCENSGKTYTLKNCSLLGIGETIGLDGDASIDFNYTASLSGNSFYIT